MGLVKGNKGVRSQRYELLAPFIEESVKRPIYTLTPSSRFLHSGSNLKSCILLSIEKGLEMDIYR